MKGYQQILLLLILCFCTFFIHIDQFFPELMELRNFITAREMIHEGNWWHTTMNLEPRLEKPPLPTWLTALSASYLGGLNDLYAMRIPSALAGTALVLFFFGFCKTLNEEKYFPLFGAAIIATCLLVIEMARQNTWDIYTHAFMVGSIWQFLEGVKNNRRSNIFWATLLMGLSILSKGPVSLYALWLPFIIAYGIHDNFKTLKKNWKYLLIIVIGGCIIGFSWNASMLFLQEDTALAVIDKETTSWTNRHVRPFYFYLHFPLYIGIWVIPLLASFFYKYAAPRINKRGNYRFLIFWVLLSVFLLSVIPEKKERYLLPAMIPMCLIVGYLLYEIIKRLKKGKAEYWDRVIYTVFTIIIYTAAICLPLLLFILAKEYLSALSIVSSIIIGLLGLTGIVFWHKKKYSLMFGSIIGLASLFCVGIIPLASKWVYQYDEFRNLAEIQTEPELKDCKVYTEKDGTDPRVVWLCGKPTQSFRNISMDDKSNYPLVFITFGPIEHTFSKEFLESIEVVSYGKYDIRRKDVRWKPLVYLLKQKSYSTTHKLAE